MTSSRNLNKIFSLIKTDTVLTAWKGPTYYTGGHNTMAKMADYVCQ